ncbi:MAG TPA: hypothetical protein VGA61_17150, partial [Anaerolineae bacterium]
ESARMMGASYLGTAAKARGELGWSTRPLSEGFAETFAWIAGREGPAPEGWPARNRPAIIALAAALAVAALMGRRDRRG